MLKLRSLLAASIIILTSSLVSAQSIDLGRGELPLTVPSNYDADTAVPLLILLHGYSFSGAFQDSYMGISSLADRYGFIFVAPDGNQESSDSQNRFWNATPACCDFFGTEVDDSGYVLNIINEVKANYNIDPARVYLVGHSNGGFMSYRVAYEHSETIAAIVSLAGANHLEERSAPDNPVHILQIHGSADSTIAYEGDEIQGNRYPGAKQSVERWAQYNGCEVIGAERELRDLDGGIDGHESSVLLYSQGCKAGGSSELWTINDGSHVPRLSDTFGQQVIEWLYAHPKTGGLSQ